jgi:hypothetical protein
MLRLSLLALAGICGVLAAKAALAVWAYADQDMSGTYAIYGGYPSQSEALPPSPGDTKAAFSVRGTAAKELFDAIGSQRAENAPAQSACPNNPQVLVRERDALICRYAPRDGYWCTFGFDLSTGLSTWGVVGGQICDERVDR